MKIFRSIGNKVRASEQVQYGIIVVSLVIFSLSVYGIIQKKQQQTPSPVDNDGAVVYTEDDPSEAEVPDSYSVAADEPLSVEIESVGIRGFIQKVGVDQNQAITAPNNVNLAGWFRDSVKPGEKGLSIIDGHVSGRSKDGVFKSLSNVKNDDIIKVTYGDGSVREFKVFENKTVPEAEAAAQLFNQKPSVTSQLNLITCAGQYDVSVRRYPDRVIVYAALQ